MRLIFGTHNIHDAATTNVISDTPRCVLGFVACLHCDTKDKYLLVLFKYSINWTRIFRVRPNSFDFNFQRRRVSLLLRNPGKTIWA